MWTFTEPVSERTQIAGIPVATLFVDPQLPRSNVVVNLCHVDPAERATMLSRGAGMVGEEVIRMWPTDWVLEPRHRLGIRVMDANSENYVHVPTNGAVQLISGRVAVPFLPEVRVSDTHGEMAPRLETYLSRAPFDVSEELDGSAAQPLLG